MKKNNSSECSKKNLAAKKPRKQPEIHQIKTKNSMYFLSQQKIERLSGINFEAGQKIDTFKKFLNPCKD